MIAYFRMIVNPDDEEAFKRIINYPKRGIGETTVAKISGLASVAGVSLWRVICEPENMDYLQVRRLLSRLPTLRN